MQPGCRPDGMISSEIGPLAVILKYHYKYTVIFEEIMTILAGLVLKVSSECGKWLIMYVLYRDGSVAACPWTGGYGSISSDGAKAGWQRMG